MSEEQMSNFDEGFFKIRSKIASENMEWYKLFKRRNSLMILMILSAVLVNSLFILLFYFNSPFDPMVFLIIPNLTWAVICLPYFYIQIKRLTKTIEQKREEAVIQFYKLNKSTKDIALSTGIRIDFVEYYLTKNHLAFEPYKHTS